MKIKANITLSEDEREAMLRMRNAVMSWNCDCLDCEKCIFNDFCETFDSDDEGFIAKVVAALEDSVK